MAGLVEAGAPADGERPDRPERNGHMDPSSTLAVSLRQDPPSATRDERRAGCRSGGYSNRLTWGCAESGRRESNPRSQLGKLMFCL